MTKPLKDQNSKKWGRVEHSGSNSLWNYTLSPGWNDEEVNILKNALQLFGIGRWKAIISSNCLPGKTIGQIYMQTQRLIGQQSLGDFVGLQVDLQKIYLDNMKKTGVLRKNNSIINTGDNPNREEKKKRNEENLKKYGLSAEQIAKITIPRYKSKLLYQYLSLEELESKKYTTIEIIKNLDFIQKLLKKKIERYDQEKEEYNPNKKIVLNLNQVGQGNKKRSLFELDNIQYFDKNELIFEDPSIITLKRMGNNNKKFKIIEEESSTSSDQSQ